MSSNMIIDNAKKQVDIITKQFLSYLTPDTKAKREQEILASMQAIKETLENIGTMLEGTTTASPIIVSHNHIDPHPILKNKSLTGKDYTKEETRPKSILKKKTNSEDSSRMNKVKPILKKNKSSEDFHHNISSSSSSSNSSISSLPRSIRRNSDSP